MTIQILNPSQLDRLLERGSSTPTYHFKLLSTPDQLIANEDLKQKSSIVVPPELDQFKHSILIFDSANAQEIG